MKQQLMNQIVQGMLPYLNNAQMAQLQEVLEKTLCNVEVTKNGSSEQDYQTNVKLIELFLSAKRVEGCSEKSLKYYKTIIETILETVGKNVQEIETDDLRMYLTDYHTFAKLLGKQLGLD